MNLLKKIMLWTAASLLVLLVIAAIVLPRVINTDAVKAAIERTISRDLGGTLTYERVVLSILPRPHIVLQKPKIEIPQRVSAAMDSLDIYPAILPLLTGTFRINDVHLGRPQVALLLQELPAPTNRRKNAAAPSGPSPEEVLAIGAKSMTGITIAVDNGTVTVVRRSEQVIAVSGIDARTVFLPVEAGAGGTSHPADASFRISGEASCSFDAPDLPAGPLTLTVGHFDALPRRFSFSGASVRIMDLSLSLSGSISDYLSDRRKADVSLSGTAGPNVLLWLRDSAALSPLLTLRSPLSLSNTRVRWEQSGTLRTTGHAVVRKGPEIDFDVQRSPGAISLKRLAIRDTGSQVLVTAELSDRVLDLTFSGSLTQYTLDRLLEQERFRFGWIKGDLKARVPLDHLTASSAEGVLETEKVVIPGRKKVPLVIDRLSVSAHGRDLALDTLALSLGASKGLFTGTIAGHDDGPVLDLSLTSREVAWNDLQALFAPKRSGEEPPEGQAKKGPEKVNVRGTLRVSIDSLRGQRLAFQPVRGEIRFDKDRTRYDVRESKVCGVNFAGTAEISRGKSDILFRMTALHQELEPTLACLSGSDMKITGNFDLSGTLAGQGPNETLMRMLGGKVAFTARKGRVYNDFLVMPIIKYKKITHLFPDTSEARKNGIPYDTFGIRGTVQGGVFALDEGVFRSPLMNLAAHGDIDLEKETLNIDVLVAPYTTVDAIVRHIPLLGKILGGTLITIPLNIEGPLKEPRVTTLPPAAIGEGLLGIMKRTLELPFTVIEDLIPKTKEGTDSR